MQLKPNDFIYTPDEETFNRAVAAFVEAGANLDQGWCEWALNQHKYGVVWGEDGDLVSHNPLMPEYSLVSLDDL